MARMPKVAKPVEDYNFYLNARQTSMVRVAWTEYQGREGLDIREHYLNDDDEWQPTGKGLRIKKELVPDFVDWLKGEMENAINNEPEPEPEPAPRRGRGRPAREPEPVIPDDEGEPEPEPVVRRGRGRPARS